MRIAINGFGRIGRAVFKVLRETYPNDVEIVAINDLTDNATSSHLLSYDSVFGTYEEAVTYDAEHMYVGKDTILMVHEKDPKLLPWKKLNIDLVLECTGRFLTTELATAHIEAGSRLVLLSAPAKDATKTVVFGVNHHTITEDDTIVSNASCTTNCMAPVTDVLHRTFGVRSSMMTTIHSYTSSQSLVDMPNKDLRRARAAAMSMIPTTTGAAISVTKTIPELTGKLTGMSIRVPTPNVSLVDATFLLDMEVSRDDVIETFIRASEASMKGVLAVSSLPLVSVDFVGSPFSAIVDTPLLQVNGPMVKVFAWYDNEWGYSSRLADMVVYWGKIA